uniref:26S proteasome non-ATPase regulatory subunit 13 n=1 Tax=Myxobolus squamalis TaxID=59785 RepID=A0A6B2FXA4_MYXSQ
MDEAIAFLEKSSKLDSIMADESATVICTSYKAKILLYKNEILSAHDILVSLLLRVQSKDLSNIAFVYFYDFALYYYFLDSDHTSYYHDALKFYGFKGTASIYIDDDGVEKAYITAVSCIMSPHITNVGAVIYNKIIATELTKPKYFPIVDLLAALDGGNMEMFEAITPILIKHDIFSSKMDILKEKIVLMNILNLSFTCIIQNIIMTFPMIACSANIPIEMVEHFLIRAFSLEIVKGSIDQVNHTVNLTWVKPKFLAVEQIALLQAKLKLWNERIDRFTYHMSDITQMLTP